MAIVRLLLFLGGFVVLTLMPVEAIIKTSTASQGKIPITDQEPEEMQSEPGREPPAISKNEKKKQERP